MPIWKRGPLAPAKKLFNVVLANVLGFLKGKELKMMISDLKITVF